MKNDTVETVGLRELSNSLSTFVRKASLGVRVLITDRGKVIAEICKASFNQKVEGHPLKIEWEATGKLIPATGKRATFPRGHALMPDRNVDVLLDDIRGE